MKRIICTILFCIFVFSCSNDDDNACPISNTEITMQINGENLVFSLGGYGIDLTENGKYDLRLWLDHYDQETDTYYQITVRLYLYETGQNVIDSFYFRKDQGIDYLEGDLTTMVFEDRVFSNRDECFSAEFTGEFIISNTESIIISNGQLDVIYDEPFN